MLNPTSASAAPQFGAYQGIKPGLSPEACAKAVAQTQKANPGDVVIVSVIPAGQTEPATQIMISGEDAAPFIAQAKGRVSRWWENKSTDGKKAIVDAGSREPGVTASPETAGQPSQAETPQKPASWLDRWRKRPEDTSKRIPPTFDASRPTSPEATPAAAAASQPEPPVQSGPTATAHQPEPTTAPPAPQPTPQPQANTAPPAAQPQKRSAAGRIAAGLIGAGAVVAGLLYATGAIGQTLPAQERPALGYSQPQDD